MNTLLLVASYVVTADPVPDETDVKAGWGAFFLFLALCVAVGLLGWSLVRHLKKTGANRDAGVFGDGPADKDEPQA